MEAVRGVCEDFPGCLGTTMNAEQYRRISEAFDELVELPPDQRAGELAVRFVGEPEVRAEVEALLAEHDRIDAPVGTAVGLEAAGKSLGADGRASAVRVVSPEELLPVLKGAYRLLRVIGEGGMGVVYEAEQSFPRRRVALKSIRSGFATASMLRRFKTEIQLLARLDHPGIAQVYEAGYADDRSPDQAFLAMELVEGQALNRYARGQDLPMRERLGLMLKVCDAVQHAHQRGVIHRDLKPANILVTQAGQPKVLDFGIARAVDEIDEGTMVTRAGQVVGTPSYMSPEQLRGEAVDTRADVYALGVMMYELLSDELPFDVSKVPLSEALRVVMERAAPLSKVKSTLRGDVETVVSIAMHPDRDRRYSSSAAMADDIRCVLDNRPINARRDSAVYVLGKFARRHKAMVSVLGVLVVALVAFGVFSATMSAVNARLARESDEARLKAEDESKKNAALSQTLEVELSAARIDRARAEAAVGKFKLAEDSLWTEYLTHRDSPQAYWGLWELYHRIPCLWTNYSSEAPTSAAIAESGRLVVLGFASGRVDVHSGSDGSKMHSIGPLGAAVGTVAVSSRDEIGIGLANGGVVLVEAGDGASQRKLVADPPHTAGIRVMAFSGDGKRLAAGSSDRRISVWDGAAGSLVDSWVAGSESASSLAMNADGSELASITGQAAEDRSWWRLGASRERSNIVLPGQSVVFGVNFLADSKTLAIGYAVPGAVGRGYALGLLDLGTMTLVEQVGGLSARVSGVSEAPGGGALAARSGQTLILVQRNAAQTATAGTRGMTSRSLGQQRGTLLASGFFSDGRIITVSDRAEIRCFSSIQEPAVTLLGGFSTWCFSVAWSPDGKRLSIDGGRLTTVYEAGDRSEDSAVGRAWTRISTTTLERPIRHRGMQFLSDSRTVVMAGGDGRIRVVDSTTGAITATLGVPRHEAYSMAVLKDERTILSGHTDGVIRVWDRVKGEMVRELPKLERRPEGIAVSPDGKMVASSGLNTSIAIWDTSDWGRVGALDTTHAAWGVAYSPDGREIAVTTHTGTLQVFRVETGERRALIQAHQRLAPGLAYSPDGKLIATASEDGSVRLWDATSLRQLVTFDGNSAEIVTVAFDPTSRYLAASSAGLTALVFDLRWADAAIKGNYDYQEALYRLYGAGKK